MSVEKLPLPDSQENLYKIVYIGELPERRYKSDCSESSDTSCSSEVSSGTTDENVERGNWGRKLDFLLSCLGYAVGLGNVWRFPYLCYRNGGGAFLIPYVIMLIFAGLPMFFLELSFGQYASLGPISIWKVSPLFQGIGCAMVTVSAMVAVYYNMIIAWAFFYLFSSLRASLPWQGCGNWWNTELCSKIYKAEECHLVYNGSLLANGTCILPSGEFIHGFTTNMSTSLNISRKSPSDEYFHNYVLSITDGLHDLGEVKWELALCLLAAWVVVFLCMMKGVKSSGKVVYFTATFPYLVLFILLIRGLTLSGAKDGVLFYLTPNFSKLLEAKVWGDAATQIFFSLSPCWGGLITLASYNRFNNNCYKDALNVAIGNCLTSVFAGFVIFSIIGFMAHELGMPIDKVASQGAGLAFIAYPEVVTRLPVSPLWSVLFFVMLITLGLGTQFAIVETVITAIVDEFPNQLRKRKTFVVLFICTCGFLLGLTCCSKGGMYMLQLMDSYAASWSVLIIGIFELLAVGWVYGVDHFMDNVQEMLGFRPSLWWKILWKYVTPALLSALLLFSWIMYQPASYGDYVFPGWANALGWCISLTSVSMIPVVAIYRICRAQGPIVQRLRELIRPAKDWGPALEINRRPSDEQTTESRTKLMGPDVVSSADSVCVSNLSITDKVSHV